MSDARRIYEHFWLDPDGTIGYVIYRVTYKSDEEWARFLRRLDHYARARIEMSPEPELIRDRVQWDIREDKAKYDGASKSQIRQ